MSCGCTSTATPSPSITCGSCGYQCTSCVCPPDPIVMPTVTCADPATCTEIYPLECVQYTGEDIKCSTSAATLYPNTTHIVATNGDMLPDILNNINNQLCYLFSADFINQMLTNIDNSTDLTTILCNIVSDCGTTPTTTLICPTVSSVTYNVDPVQNYLQATFSYVPYATNYTYKFYTESVFGSGTYDTPVGSGSLPQPSIALPITVTAMLSPAYPSTKNYAVRVQATASGYTAGGLDTSLSTFTYNDPSNLHCGINKYSGIPATQSCRLSTLTGNFKASPANPKALQFIFTQESSNPAYIPVVSYTVHWYLQTFNGVSYSYVYQGNKVVTPYSAGTQTFVDLYKLPVTIASANLSKTSTTLTVTSTAHGLSTNMYITIDTAITGVNAGTYFITVTDVNTFQITTTGNAVSLSGSQSLTYKSQINPATDKVVTMIYTSANPECYKGIPYVANTNPTYTDVAINSFISNSNNNVFKNFQ